MGTKRTLLSSFTAWVALFLTADFLTGKTHGGAAAALYCSSAAALQFVLSACSCKS